jgi:hypothetical protein
MWGSFDLQENVIDSSFYIMHHLEIFIIFFLVSLFFMSIFVSMQLELFLNAAELCLACYSVVTGIFGMNIQSGWEHNYDYMFKWVITIKLCFNTIFK